MLEFVDQFVNDVVDDRLAIRRHVAGLLAIEIGAAHIQRIERQDARDVVDQVFDRDRALRSTEAAKGGVRLRVRLPAQREDVDIFQIVGVVEVAERARRDGARQVGRVAGAKRHFDLRAKDSPVIAKADVVGIVAAVPLAGNHEVVVAVDAQFHRTLQPLRGDGGDARKNRRLRFLAAEAAAHPPDFARHLVGRQVQRVRDDILHLGRMLRRTPQVDAIVFLRHSIRNLPLEVELFLAPDIPFAGDASRRARQRFRRITAHQMHRRQYVRALVLGLLRREDRRQDFIVDACQPRRAPCRVVRIGEHREQRLPRVLDEAIGQDRVVVNDRAAIVDPWNIRGDEHVDHACRGADRCQVHSLQASVCLGAQAQRRIHGSRQFRNVVGVGRLAGDVQMRRLVRRRDAGCAFHALVIEKRFALAVHLFCVMQSQRR